MSNGVLMGNAFGLYYIQMSLTPVAVAPTTAPLLQTFTVPGLKATDSVIDADPPSDTAGLVLAGAVATATNTIGLKFINPTAGSLTPPSGLYTFTILRPASGTPALSIGD